MKRLILAMGTRTIVILLTVAVFCFPILAFARVQVTKNEVDRAWYEIIKPILVKNVLYAGVPNPVRINKATATLREAFERRLKATKEFRVVDYDNEPLEYKDAVYGVMSQISIMDETDSVPRWYGYIEVFYDDRVSRRVKLDTMIFHSVRDLKQFGIEIADWADEKLRRSILQKLGYYQDIFDNNWYKE